VLEADPIFALGSIIWLLAVGVWPVAIMLGSSCSPCCTKIKIKVQCRCVRYEQQTHDATPNSGSYSYYAPVTHGWSAVASAPRDAGIRYLTTNGFGWQFENSPDPTNARQWQWLPPRGDAVTDSTRVHNFWLGTETLSYVDADNKTILVRTEDWSEACGQALCSNAYANSANGALRAVFHAQHPKRSATRTYVNTLAACAGQAGTSVSSPMKLNGCEYVTNWNTCAMRGIPDNAINWYSYARLEFHYCGDLLWAIENGPCRNSIAYTAGYTVTLSDDAGIAAGNRRICFNDESIPDGDGKCHPAEATISISGSIPVYKYPEVNYGDREQIGSLSGDYVCQWKQRYDNNCLFHDFISPPINFQSSGGVRTLRLVAQRRRQDWTGDEGATYNQITGNPCLPWKSGRSYVLPASANILSQDIETLATASVTFSAAQDPLPKTITADTAQIAPEGQTVTYTYCCDNVYQAPQNQQPVLVPQTTPQPTVFTRTYPANNTLSSIFWPVYQSDTVLELEQPPRGCVFQDWKFVGAKPCGMCPNNILSLPSGYSASGDTVTVPWGTHLQGYDDDDNFYSYDVGMEVQRFIASPLTPTCAIQPTSNAAWITTSIYMPGITNVGYIRLTIAPNLTGQQRTGTVTVPCGTSGASTWTVIQQPQ
jgi:hypothetical protein